MTEPKEYTMADIMRERTPEEQGQARQEEAAFRRGYFYGVDDAIEAMRDGVTLQALIDYYNGPLWKWRFKDDDSKEVHPPAIPRPKAKKSGHLDH